MASITGVFCGPAGVFVVRIGPVRCALGFGLACFLSAALTVFALEFRLFGVMLVARFFFWLFLYLLLAVQTVIVFDLFAGPQLQTAYSCVITACRLGGVLGYFLSGPLLDDSKSDPRAAVAAGRTPEEVSAWAAVKALWFSVFLVGLSFLATVFFAYLHSGSPAARLVRPLLARQSSEAQQEAESGAGSSQGPVASAAAACSSGAAAPPASR